MDAAAALMAGRTVVLVTHREGWTGGPGRVITLDHGKLVSVAAAELAVSP